MDTSTRNRAQELFDLLENVRHVDTVTRKNAQQPYDPLEIVRRRNMPAATGLSNATIWRERNAGRFPEPIRLSKQAIGWTRASIDEWKAERSRLSGLVAPTNESAPSGSSRAER